MFEKDLMLGTAQRSEKYLNTVLDKIAKAMGCQPEDHDELVEAVRLLVEERDLYRNAITKLIDSATKVFK